MSREWYHDREDEHGAAGKERWLVTYADLITLLMVFFIVMYALSARVSGEKFDQLANSLNKQLHHFTKEKPTKKQAEAEDDSHETKKFKATANAVFDALVKTDPKSNVHVDIDQRGLVVSLIDTSFFDPGSSAIKPAAYPVLRKVAETFRKLPNEVRVEGHTDAVPIHTARFPTNWELSSARATAVVRFLIDQVHIPGDRLSAVGYSDTHPVASNGTPDGRKRNRRVEMIIVRADDKDKGPTTSLNAPAPAPKPVAPKRTKEDGFGGGFSNPF